MIKIGDMIKDNDPRMPGRKLKIIGMDNTHVRASSNYGSTVSIKKDRIFTDEKERRTGFSLIHRED